MSEQNYKAFWDEALKQIHEEYKSQGQEDQFSLWFNMTYLEDSISEITVTVPSSFMWGQMVKMGNVAKVESKIKELCGQTISINYIVKKAEPAPEQVTIQTQSVPKTEPQIQSEHLETTDTSSDNTNSVSQTDNAAESVPKTEPVQFRKHPLLREDYTFDRFVTGDNSEFAYSAALAAAKNPGRRFNPLLIYGGVGLGKTHLMQSIGNYIYNNADPDSRLKICYITAENFTNEFTASLRNNTIEKFKSKYRQLDVLLLDDIHFLKDKVGTQEELFHTFEALSQKHAQMVFTCDRPLSELNGIEERLKSRFSLGTPIDLQPPNYETRLAILQKKQHLNGTQISDEVIEYIAKNVQSNVRELSSCLDKMVRYAEVIQKPVTIDIAQRELRDFFSESAGGSVNIETIQKVVANHYNISLSDIKSKKRNKKFVVPRQIAIYIARELADLSYPELGNEFGGRDHTTAMHSYEKVVDQLKTDSTLNSTVQLLIREVKDYKKI